MDRPSPLCLPQRMRSSTPAWARWRASSAVSCPASAEPAPGRPAVAECLAALDEADALNDLSVKFADIREP
jgi:hypothetical protein